MCNFQVFLCCCCFFTNFWGAKSALLGTLFACLTRRNSSLSQWPLAMSLKETPGGIAPLPFLAPLTLNIFCGRTSGMEAFVHKKLTMQGNLPWADNSLFLFFACLLPGRKEIPSRQLYYCVKSLRGWKSFKILILRSSKMFVKPFWPLCELHIASFHVITTWPCQRQRLTSSC